MDNCKILLTETDSYNMGLAMTQTFYHCRMIYIMLKEIIFFNLVVMQTGL